MTDHHTVFPAHLVIGNQELTETSGRMVVAIQDDSELEKAIELKKKMKCEAIVYEK